MGNGLLTANTGLTNRRVIQENEAGDIAKYLSHAFLASNCFYLHLYLKKNSKRPLNALHSVSVALVWYICQSDRLTEMTTIKVSFTVIK